MPSYHWQLADRQELPASGSVVCSYSTLVFQTRIRVEQATLAKKEEAGMGCLSASLSLGHTVQSLQSATCLSIEEGLRSSTSDMISTTDMKEKCWMSHDVYT